MDKIIGVRAFDSEEYCDCLRNLISNDVFKSCTTEEDIRKKFENETNRILRLIKAIPQNEYIQFNSEVGIFSGGRIDSKYKNIIIEYKKYKRLDSDVDHREAKNQLCNYLNDDSFLGKSVYGILFDGKTMEIYHKNENGAFEIPRQNLSGLISFKSLDFYFKTAFLRNKKELNSYSLCSDFNIDTKFIKETYRTIYGMLNKYQNPRTKLMFNEWKKMFKLSESDNSNGEATHPDILERRRVLADLIGQPIDDSKKEYMAIFSLHTLFSLIIKLILVKSVNEFKSVLFGEPLETVSSFGMNELHDFFARLENGEMLRNAGFINMIEGDFFSWYTKENNLWSDELSNHLKNIILSICEYEDVRVKTYSMLQDLFRELYEAFIPHIIRHCFGEYYTPYWLAQNVIKDASNDKGTFFSILDPCCGSGTFLISAINQRIIELDKNEDITKKIDFSILTKSVYGIDLNPLAVLMARVNIFINSASHINDFISIEMPVYNGDSTYSPVIKKVFGLKMLEYSLNTTIMGDKTFDISLPYDFVKSDSFFSTIDKIEKSILKKDLITAKNTLLIEVNKICGDIDDRVKHLLESEIEKLVDLEKQELNGIWLRIFSNYLKTGVLPKFDCIVGNPPWVRWNVLPENYRLTVKSKCKLDGLFSGDTNNGGVDLNICALIANKSCEKWLSENGRLSFLMPKNILFNKSFEGFRNFIVDNNGGKKKCYFESIKDWSKAGDPFGDVKESFCTYNISFKKKNYSTGIPEYRVIKNGNKKLKNNSLWKDVSSNFEITERLLCTFNTENNNNFSSLDNAKLKEKIDKIIGKNEYNFRKGVDAQAPMRLTFKKMISEDEAEFYLWKKNKSRLFQTDKTIVLEIRYIRPFVTAPMIEKNSIKWTDLYIICPYENTNVPVDVEALIKNAPRTARYLLSNESMLSNRSAFNKRIQNNKEFYALLRMGKYCFYDFYLAIRDNSKFVACVVEKLKTPWGLELTPIFDGHVSFIVEKSKGSSNSISKSEAKYIASILNLSICNTYITNSVSLRSIGTRFSIRIPKFRPNSVSFEKFNKIINVSSTDSDIETAYFDLIKSIS